MHCRAALLHLQRLVLQPWRQPHLTNSSEVNDACGIVVHSGQNNPVSCFIQPHSSGLGNAGERFSTCPQIWPPWYAALRICWCNAACVGGSLSIDRPFFVNNCFLAKSILVQVLVPSYSSMTKCSMLDKQAVDGLSGALHSCSKLSDTSGKLTQVPQHSVYHGQGRKRLCHSLLVHGRMEDI